MTNPSPKSPKSLGWKRLLLPVAFLVGAWFLAPSWRAQQVVFELTEPESCLKRVRLGLKREAKGPELYYFSAKVGATALQYSKRLSPGNYQVELVGSCQNGQEQRRTQTLAVKEDLTVSYSLQRLCKEAC